MRNVREFGRNYVPGAAPRHRLPAAPVTPLAAPAAPGNGSPGAGRAAPQCDKRWNPPHNCRAIRCRRRPRGSASAE